MAAVVFVAILLIVGAGIGFFVGRGSSQLAKKVTELETQVTELETQLSASKQQYASYQIGVTEHFQKTAQLFTDLSQQYKGVYQHLAAGAQALCQDGSLYEQLQLFKAETPATAPVAFVPVFSEEFTSDVEIEEEFAEPKETAVT